MKNLFNDGWQFSELALDESSMYKDGNPILFSPDQFYELTSSQKYENVRIPHDWQIHHVKDLYKNSVGFYKKSFSLTAEEINGRYCALRFEAVYMNSAVWVNGKKAGEWKHGYSTFEFNISPFVHEGENEVIVIAVYQNCNTRWYSGAGIIRDVYFINSSLVHLPTDGVYFTATPVQKSDLSGEWNIKISVEVSGPTSGHKIENIISTPDGEVFAKSEFPLSPIPLRDEESDWLHQNVPSLTTTSLSHAQEELAVENPTLWELKTPFLYILTTKLMDKDDNVIDEIHQNCGFKLAEFTSDKGFFLNGRHQKLYGVCQHHDLGVLGAAFNVTALRRQFTKLKDMGVNAIRCSHNPPPSAWMNLCDEMGLLVDDEIFDMWEKTKTTFDYGNYFNDWCERDVTSWVRRDRNHPCLIMWSIGNEIYDTHKGNGFEITKRLYSYVQKNDPNKNALITTASNYMMTENAQKCATELDLVGYNYAERLYDEHHKKNPEWKIYGSETGSTVQSRSIYHFPASLKLVTFSDGQCSSLGNCTTPWGCESPQKVIANDRDCPYSAGQFLWTGWDYIGEPTPYHSKSSFFGQIDTAGFPKDNFYLFKAEWAGQNTEPFVHLLPYWDWNEGQKVDVIAYSNADEVELFFNGTSLGRQTLNHKDGAEPFGHWNVEYHKGEIKAVAYDKNGNVIAEDVKKSFEDPAKILLKPEPDYSSRRNCEERIDEALHFIQIMLADKDGTLVENARNYITFNVAGDAELIGMDNGDSTDFEEYLSTTGRSQTRKLFANRLIAVVRSKSKGASFVITAASAGLPNVSMKYNGTKSEWSEVAPYMAIRPETDFIPARKIELTADGSTDLTANHREVHITAKVFPENASCKEIKWNPVLKECVASDNIEVSNNTVRAAGDGECILRCTIQNNTDYDEVISDMAFTVSGIGTQKLDPYTLVEACRFSDYDSSDGKERPEMSLESGISNRKCGATWVSFNKVDFGSDGAETIHLPIFSFATELPIEIWDGKGTSGECLGRFTYSHESIYNTYSENVFTLSRRLFGLHTITIVMQTDIYLHGFYFEKTPKAYATLRALDADLITGDSFTKTNEAVEQIGNNVNLDFANMDFGDKPAKSITICGKSNTENNTINIKYFGADGSSSIQVIEFAHTNDYEEKTFEIAPVTGSQKISFVFLPGSNFDFKWFRFK